MQKASNSFMSTDIDWYHTDNNADETWRNGRMATWNKIEKTNTFYTFLFFAYRYAVVASVKAD
jgi:hypothetical protein